MMYEFRDHGLNGEMTVFCEAEEPAFLVGLSSEVRLRYGEFDDLIPLMNIESVFGPVAVISLPKDQEEIDRLFQSTGRTQKFIQEWKKLQNIQ